MTRFSYRSRTSLILAGLVLAVASVTLDPVFAQTTTPSVTQPAQNSNKAPAPGTKANTGAPSSTGVGSSPIEGTGETGNGRVLNGTGGSGASAPPGTRDPNTGTAGGAAGPVSPN